MDTTRTASKLELSVARTISAVIEALEGGVPFVNVHPDNKPEGLVLCHREEGEQVGSRATDIARVRETGLLKRIPINADPAPAPMSVLRRSGCVGRAGEVEWCGSGGWAAMGEDGRGEKESLLPSGPPWSLTGLLARTCHRVSLTVSKCLELRPGYCPPVYDVKCIRRAVGKSCAKARSHHLCPSIHLAMGVCPLESILS